MANDNNTIKLNGIDVEYNNIYYIATDGNNTTGNGTKENPFATYDKAFSVAISGDLIYFKKGVYNIIELNNLYSTTSSFLYDQEKQLTIYAELFTYIKINNPTTAGTHVYFASIRNSNSKIIGFIVDWNVINKSPNYNRPLFGSDGGVDIIRGSIYNCHFIIRSTTSFSYANTSNTLQVINCQFDIKVTPEAAYSGTTKFVNCTMNLSSWNSVWGINTVSTILTGISYSNIYKIIPSNNVYGVYNADYKWFISSKYLIKQNNTIYTYDDINNTIIESPSQELNSTNFKENGFDPLIITEEQWNSTFPDKTNLQLLKWTGDTSITESTITCNVEPYSYKPIDQFGENNILGASFSTIDNKIFTVDPLTNVPFKYNSVICYKDGVKIIPNEINYDEGIIAFYTEQTGLITFDYTYIVPFDILLYKPN